MLWLCLYFSRLPAEALGLQGPFAAAVAQLGARRWLVTSAQGVEAGLSQAAALSLQPRLSAHLRQPAAERERLRALAHAAYRYGSPVCTQMLEPHHAGQLPMPLLWVEVGSSLNIHEGLETLCAALRADLAELGSVAQLGVAPTRLGAALLARGDDPRPAKTTQELKRRLSVLPLHFLHWPQELLDNLSGMGLKTLGDAFSLPRQEFGRRFGDHALLQLDRIYGRAAHPFQAIHLPPFFERRFEFFQEVESREGLLFPLRRLCVELQHYLRARSSGVCAVRLGLVHAQGVCTGFEHRYAIPTRDGTHLLNTLRERLQRLEPGAPVRELRLFADDFAQPPLAQGELFGEATRGLEWQQALERLRARLGDEAAWTPAATGDHRPERSWCRQGNHATAPPAEFPARPAWLLRQPQPIAEPVHKLSAIERIEYGWWDGQGIRRDYCTAEINGARAWVFRDHRDGSWHLHGWWA